MIIDTTVSKMESKIQKRLERPVIGSLFDINEISDLPALDSFTVDSFTVDMDSCTVDMDSCTVGNGITFTFGTSANITTNNCTFTFCNDGNDGVTVDWA